MNRKYCLLLLLIGLSLSGVEAGRLEIYLPRTVRIEGDVVNLGQVGIFQGNNELSVRAGAVALGRFSVPGQKITLDRKTIESCLAGGGISYNIPSMR